MSVLASPHPAVLELLEGTMWCEPSALEGIATVVHEVSGGTGRMRDLARAAGVRIVETRTLPTTLDGLLVLTIPKPTAYIRVVADRRAMVFATCHEIGHWLLKDIEHGHPDVQYLALCLGIPRRHARSLPLVLTNHECAQLPDWALDLRATMFRRFTWTAEAVALAERGEVQEG